MRFLPIVLFFFMSLNGCDNLPDVPGLKPQAAPTDATGAPAETETPAMAEAKPVLPPPAPLSPEDVIANVLSKNGMDITDQDLMQLAELPSHREKITALDLKSSKLSVDGFHALTSFPALRQVDLQAALLGPEHCEILGRLKSLEWLNLSRSSIDNRAIGHLAQLSGLTWLDLSHTVLSDDGLATLSGLTSLQELRINNTDVYGKGLAALGKDGSRAPLKVLQASNSQLGYQGFIEIKQIRGLEELHASGASITDGSLEGLKGQNDLRVVKLAGNMFSDVGLKYLSAANPVVELDLSNNRGVSDATLKRLKAFRELRQLNLDQTSCSLKGVEMLKKSLPDCEILFQQQKF